MKPTSPANINYAWAELMVREFGRLGVDTFFIAPGSRSSPLTLTAARLAANVIIHFDERGIGFAALGYARASGKPAVVVTTSGSAVANLWPSVCEASTDHVPMILLTADRPPELRDTGANQTMDQVKLFSGYVRWQVDMACPDTAIPASFVLSSIDEAVTRATHLHPGPVHINQMFREPLTPETKRDGSSAWIKSPAVWWTSDQPWSHHEPVILSGRIDEAMRVIRSAKRGVIVAGTLPDRREAEAVLAIAEKLGWPILPDIRSGLRLSPGHDLVISMTDQILLSAKFNKSASPDVVLHCGGRITSKRLLQFLAGTRPTVVQLQPVPGRIDPDLLVSQRYTLAPSSFAALMETYPPVPANKTWAGRWQKAQRAVLAAWETLLHKQHAVTEPSVAAQISSTLAKSHGLVLASSMPIRDMEMYGIGAESWIALASNRGVSGIDGNLATAVGFARGLGHPVTLVIGDLALLHDLNSLALVKSSPYPITVVVVNNHGGGIFSFLPIAKAPGPIETCFGTPHGWSFESAATMFGLAYEHPDTLPQVAASYRRLSRSGASSIIEVVIDRKANVIEHQRIQTILKAAVEHVR